MKTHLQILLTLCCLAALSLYTGCASSGGISVPPVADIVDQHPLVSKAVIQYAAVSYIDNDADRAAEVLGAIEYVEYITTGETAYTLDTVVGAVKNELDWDRYTPEQTILLLNLIDGVSGYVAQRLESPTALIDPHALVTVNQVLGWIRDAAQLTPSQRQELRAGLGATEASMLATFLAKFAYLWVQDHRSPPAEQSATQPRQDLVGHLFQLREPVPEVVAAPIIDDRTRKLHALAVATQPDGRVDPDLYRYLAQ